MQDFKVAVFQQMPDDNVLETIEPGTVVIVANDFTPGRQLGQAAYWLRLEPDSAN